MQVKKYWEVPAISDAKAESMIKEIEGYLGGKLNKCHVMIATDQSASDIVCTSYGKKKEGPVVLEMRISYEETVCRVNLEYNINRVIWNIVFAVLLIVAFPVSCVLLVTAIFRMRAYSKMEKELMEIMRKYAF